MNVVLEQILSKGSLDEALVINILQDGNLKSLCIYDQTKHPEDSDIESPNLIWMFHESTLVKKDDKVFLYSGSDQNRVWADCDEGINMYRFYMSADQPIWMHADESAFLFVFADFPSIEDQQREFLQ